MKPVLQNKKLGWNFIKNPHLPGDKDEFYLRDAERQDNIVFRGLSRWEKRRLVQNGNTADNWENLLVADSFSPNCIRNSAFFGKNRIGPFTDKYLQFHDLMLPTGITDSTIVSCDIGTNSAIHSVRYLSRYIIGKEVILFNIDEMITTDHAKFGNGITKDGEDEEVRIWLEIANEKGGRKILPFETLLPADAYLWSHYRSNPNLLAKLKQFTDNEYSSSRGYYGSVGEQSVIKSCRIIKDVKIGEYAYIKGVNKLKNLTIMSRKDATTQIGEGVELVNGIINVGCRIFYGAKAVRFCLRTNASLKYGARLINSILGDNGTISCCEVLNSIIFPSHEQHHNNSFLVAATVQGQSNIAAGATIGSNHNSRANDGELFAGRGFWPGLCVSLKHSSKFASFCLVAKGSYPAELNIPLPFCLVSNDQKNDRLQLLPGYWFMYNMYALARNSWKYEARDLKLYKWQQLEHHYLAPDTIEELFNGMALLEKWSARSISSDEPDSTIIGKEALESGKIPSIMTVEADIIEASAREVVVLKASEGYAAYREMIHYYGIRELLLYMKREKINTIDQVKIELEHSSRCDWINLGGQVLEKERLEGIIKRIASDTVSSWDDLHTEYGAAFKEYPKEKARHALGSLLSLHAKKETEIDGQEWQSWLNLFIEIQTKLVEKTIHSRDKDYDNPFRQMMYETREEMALVVGSLSDNEFLSQLKKESLELETYAAGFVT